MRHPPRLQRPTCAQGPAAGAVEEARRERQVAASQCPPELESLGSFAPLPSRHCFSASRLQQPQRPQRGSARGPALLKSFAAAGSSPPVRQELFLELRAASVRPSNHRCRLLGSAGAPERLPSRPAESVKCFCGRRGGKLAALASPCAVEALGRRSVAATMRAWAPAARSPPLLSSPLHWYACLAADLARLCGQPALEPIGVCPGDFRVPLTDFAARFPAGEWPELTDPFGANASHAGTTHASGWRGAAALPCAVSIPATGPAIAAGPGLELLAAPRDSLSF